MVKLKLSVRADLENVTNLVPASDEFEYFFKVFHPMNICGPPGSLEVISIYDIWKVKCNSCHEDHPKLVSLNRLVRPPAISRNPIS